LSCWCYVYIEFWFLCVSTLEFEDTTGAIRIRKSEKNREHIGQKTEEQRTHWPKDRRTENTLAKRKRTNGQTTIYKTYIATQNVEYVISSQNLPAWQFHGGDKGSEE
jgi:hypothetical protein